MLPAYAGNCISVYPLLVFRAMAEGAANPSPTTEEIEAHQILTKQPDQTDQMVALFQTQFTSYCLLGFCEQSAKALVYT